MLRGRRQSGDELRVQETETVTEGRSSLTPTDNGAAGDRLSRVSMPKAFQTLK
jgi:hypothetical protein